MGFTENIQTNLSALSSLIGEDNVEDIKKRIADLIVSAVANDVKYYRKQSYVFTRRIILKALPKKPLTR